MAEEGDEGNFAGNKQNSHNVLLAYQIHRALVNRLPVDDRGVRRARYEVLRLATVPAVLIEGGFMTDPTEAERIYDANYRKRMAQAIVEGLLAYKRVVERG